MPLEPNAVTVALLVVAGLVMAILGRAVGRAIAEMRWRRRPGGAVDAPPVVTVVVRHATASIPPADSTPPGPTPTPAPTAISTGTIAWPDPAAAAARPATPASRLADMPAPIAYRRPSPAPLSRTAQQRPLDAEASPAPLAAAQASVPLGAAAPGVLATPPARDPFARAARRRRRGLLASSAAALAVVAIVALGVGALLPPSPQSGILGASASPRGTDTAAATPGGPPTATSDPDGSTARPSSTGRDGGGAPGTPVGRPGGGDTAGEPGGPVPPTPGPAAPTRPVDPSPPPTGEPTSSPGPRPTLPPPTASPGPTPGPTPAPTSTPAPTATAAPTPVPPQVTFTWTATGLTVKFTNATSGPHRWSWDFGDGATSTTRNPSHAYAEAGTYLVRLTATTSGGTTGTHVASVTVP